MPMLRLGMTACIRHRPIKRSRLKLAAYLAVDAKVANAKHAANTEGDGSALAQTGDPVGEVFWIGGVAFVAAGVAIGASAASRRRSDAE